SSLIDKQKDEFYRLNHHQIIANREPILHNKNLVGWVLSFREQNDVYAVSASLTQIKQYSDNFRVLRHEFSNKLTTLSGLLKMGKIQEAMILINNESGSKQELLDFIQHSIRVNQVAAFLLGKALRAQELNIDFRLDPTCQLSNNQTKLDDHQLCTVLGNLIENAFDSCRINQTKSPYVGILITDAGQDILIEVSDNGSGLSIQEKEVIWNRGVTRKDDKEDHGLGLYLVDHYVKQAGGFINIDNAEPQGCIFSVFIPNYINN
ncbi:GHKL domain-containing protein, partial [Vibrio metschnikovii]|nr:GHKL domain-containing protein [Vibrio metschnikovii]